MTTIVTNCSKRKRTAPDARLRAGNLNSGSLAAVAREWAVRLETCGPLVEAGRLYSGRQFSEALQAVRALDAELLIISAGLGVIRLDDLVPSYSLTVARGASDNVLSRVDGGVAAEDWWREGTKNSRPFRTLRAALAEVDDARGLILIALPSSYLSMVEHELEQFPAEPLSRTRVFASPSFRFQDPRLNAHLMPYDARLDGPESASPGTATDFTSRALRDFVTSILPESPEATFADHAAAVSQRLEGWDVAVRPERKRQSDQDLLDVIRTNWRAAGGSASQMLRWVRSELGLACEQGRMRELYSIVRGEMEGVA